MLRNKLYNYNLLITFLKLFIVSYLIIGFTLLHSENGDEGFYLRIISDLINGRTFLRDFASNMPVITMYFFYPLKFITTNYYVGAKFLVGFINLLSFILLYYAFNNINKNNENYKTIIIFFILIFLTSNNIFYYGFQIRQWPIVFFLQISLVISFSLFFYKKNITYLFFTGLIIGLLLSTRQTYILFFPLVFMILALDDFFNNKYYNFNVQKYLFFTFGFLLGFSIYFYILIYDLPFALGLWYLLNQDIHFSNESYALKNIIFNFFGFKDNIISIQVFSTAILYIYVFFELIRSYNILKLFVFLISSAIIAVTFFGWTLGYHQEAFFVLFTYFIITINEKKIIFIRLLSVLILFITINNYFFLESNILKKNIIFLKDSFTNLAKFKFHKLENYNELNQILKNYCFNDKLTWDTRRGRILSANSNCKYHPKITNQYLTTGILNRNIYSPQTLDKIYNITLKPDELIFFIINEADLIVANDLNDLLDELDLIIKRNSLDVIMFNYFCNNFCNITENRAINLTYFRNQLGKEIANKFKIKKINDFSFFIRL